jgi:hypothetical protein
MAKMTVDQAFELLHQKKLEGKVVWNAKHECCNLHVIVEDDPVAEASGAYDLIFNIFDGIVEDEEDEPTFEDIVMMSKPRRHLTLVKS